MLHVEQTPKLGVKCNTEVLITWALVRPVDLRPDTYTRIRICIVTRPE